MLSELEYRSIKKLYLTIYVKNKDTFPLELLNFYLVNANLFPSGFSISKIFDILWFFKGFIESLQDEISSFQTGNIMTSYLSQSFSPLGVEISFNST